MVTAGCDLGSLQDSFIFEKTGRFETVAVETFSYENSSKASRLIFLIQ